MSTIGENPARFHPNIIEALRSLIPLNVPKGTLIYDPFAGDGRRLGELCDQLGYRFYGGDLEEWADADWRVEGPIDATNGEGYPSQWVKWAVVTSPTYNNGINDHFEPKDDSYRMTYRVAAGHALGPTNTGRWSGRGSRKAEKEYWRLHKLAVTYWPEIAIVNVKDSIRDKEVYPLVDMWVQLLAEHGYAVVSRTRVPCPGNRRGANGDARVDDEWVLCARKTT